MVFGGGGSLCGLAWGCMGRCEWVFVICMCVCVCVCGHISSLLSPENKRKADMIEHLKQAGFRSDPVKAWKASITDEQGDESEESAESGPDYNYLLSMQLWSLTREKKEELLKNRDAKVRVMVLSYPWIFSIHTSNTVLINNSRVRLLLECFPVLNFSLSLPGCCFSI